MAFIQRCKGLGWLTYVSGKYRNILYRDNVGIMFLYSLRTITKFGVSGFHLR